MLQKLLKKSKKVGKNKKGFTLVELIAVVAIIGVLTLIAIPMYNSSQAKARDAADEANRRILKGAAAMYLAENGVPTGAITWKGTTPGGNNDKWVDYLEAWPEYPKNKATKYKVTITTGGDITVDLQD
ncbi:MAG: prepilin-type N-terminal cleavage/methylation domain-containing protein [Clostridiaceae bacterium]|nr:prepilin-type N-terminal cleavage/methylation domain-containing protein [Clostridiaceae bacterium]